MQRSEDSEGQTIPRMFGGPGEESDLSSLEQYQDEVDRIKDAIAGNSWYAQEEEPMNEDDYDTGNLTATIHYFNINHINYYVHVVYTTDYVDLAMEIKGQA